MRTLMNFIDYVWLALGSVIAGAVLFLFLVASLKRKLHKDNLHQRQQIIDEAKHQVAKINFPPGFNTR